MVFSHCIVHYTVSEVPPDPSPPIVPGQSTEELKKVEADSPGKGVSIEVCSTCCLGALDGPVCVIAPYPVCIFLPTLTWRGK